MGSSSCRKEGCLYPKFVQNTAFPDFQPWAEAIQLRAKAIQLRAKGCQLWENGVHRWEKCMILGGGICIGHLEILGEQRQDGRHTVSQCFSPKPSPTRVKACRSLSTLGEGHSTFGKVQSSWGFEVEGASERVQQAESYGAGQCFAGNGISSGF